VATIAVPAVVVEVNPVPARPEVRSLTKVVMNAGTAMLRPLVPNAAVTAVPAVVVLVNPVPAMAPDAWVWVDCVAVVMNAGMAIDRPFVPIVAVTAVPAVVVEVNPVPAIAPEAWVCTVCATVFAPLIMIVAALAAVAALRVTLLPP
jgi:hypothetical protein